MAKIDALYNGSQVETQGDHIAEAIYALNKGVEDGFCTYRNEENGNGTLHIYSFPKGELPSFPTLSNDVFNQVYVEEI